MPSDSALGDRLGSSITRADSCHFHQAPLKQDKATGVEWGLCQGIGMSGHGRGRVCSNGIPCQAGSGQWTLLAQQLSSFDMSPASICLAGR
jgi:hypothetical protein